MSNGHAGHNHTHHMARQSLRLAFFLTVIILIAELAGGWLANSLALLSDAGHVITDIFALGLAWFAVVQAERPANARKTFGYHRVGILAALVNAVTLIVIAIAIVFEAVQRFQHPEPVQPLIMFLAAGIIILFTGWTIADPVLSIGIAALIAVGALRILRETADILMEAVPKGLSMPNLVRDMKSIGGIQDVHGLHVWCITSNMYALSCHALIENLPPSDSSSILQSLNSMLSEKYHIDHATIQFECDPHQGTFCSVNGLYCQMEECNNNHQHTEQSEIAQGPDWRDVQLR